MQELPFQLAVKVCNADTEGKLANLPYATYLSLRICKGLCAASSFHNVIFTSCRALDIRRSAGHLQKSPAQVSGALSSLLFTSDGSD